MANDTESDEEDIWNYKSVSKVKNASRKEQNPKSSFSGAKSRRLSSKVLSRASQEVVKVKLLQTERLQGLNKTCGKNGYVDEFLCNLSMFSPSEPAAKEKGTKPSKDLREKLDQENKGINILEIIDVDLESEDSIFTSSTFSSNKDCDTGKKTPSKSNLDASQTDSVGSNALAKLRSPKSNLGMKTSSKVSTKKTSPKKVASAKASGSSSQGLGDSPSIKQPGIPSFFSSPNTTTSKKRKSSEMIHVVDSSDDDIFDEETNYSGKKFPKSNNSFTTLKSSDLKADHVQNYHDVDDKLRAKEVVVSVELKPMKQNIFAVEKDPYNTEGSELSNKVVEVDVIDCGHDVDNLSDSSKKEVNIRSDLKMNNSSAVPVDDKLEGGFLSNGEDLFDIKNGFSEATKQLNKQDLPESVSDYGSYDSSKMSPVPAHCSSAETKSSSANSLSSGHGFISHASDAGIGSSAIESQAATDDINLLNEQALLTSARKQTSIFSFFKAKSNSGTSGFTTHSNLSGQKMSTFPTITARPNLRRGNTVAGTSVSSSSSLENRRIGLVKSASDTPSAQGSFWDDPEWDQQSKITNKKQCPFYKRIPGTAITVDAFRYGVIPGCEAYFLTHFHYDHYGGLTKKFAQPIYCSQVTGNLVERRLGVDLKWINCLPMWKPCQVAGVTLTLMEANHCPGAVIILFELKDGRKMLHTGDFRASPEMEDYAALKGAEISQLYLDTTYCNPSYAFPPQSEVINFVVSLVLKHMADNPHTLIVCGAYTIGKERIFAAIAKVLDSKICVNGDKKKVLDCLEDPDLKARVSVNWSEGRVHVLPMGKLNQNYLYEHLTRHSRYQSILAFQPTGWTHSDKRISLDNLRPKWSKNGITLYGVPYSEHSSFLELKRFVQFTRPKKILPTVNNGNPTARKKMDDIFRQWMEEKPCIQKSSISSSQQTKLNSWMS